MYTYKYAYDYKLKHIYLYTYVYTDILGHCHVSFPDGKQLRFFVWNPMIT